MEFYHDGTGPSSKSLHLCDAALVWHQLHPGLASRAVGLPGEIPALVFQPPFSVHTHEVCPAALTSSAIMRVNRALPVCLAAETAARCRKIKLWGFHRRTSLDWAAWLRLSGL